MWRSVDVSGQRTPLLSRSTTNQPISAVAKSEAARLMHVRGCSMPRTHSRAMTHRPARGCENRTDAAEDATLYAYHLYRAPANRALISRASSLVSRYPELRSVSDGNPLARYPNLTTRYAAISAVTTTRPRVEMPRNPAIHAAVITTHTSTPDSSVSAASTNTRHAAMSTVHRPRLCARFSPVRHSTETTR